MISRRIIRSVVSPRNICFCWRLGPQKHTTLTAFRQEKNGRTSNIPRSICSFLFFVLQAARFPEQTELPEAAAPRRRGRAQRLNGSPEPDAAARDAALAANERAFEEAAFALCLHTAQQH